MKLSSILVAIATIASASPLPRHRKAFGYANTKIRGVNLGGWFVLEPWITPSIFKQWEKSGKVVDEYSFSAALGKEETHRRLSKHWDTWITRKDFKAIAAAGLNHVRIPIGYWALTPLRWDPYIQGQLKVLDRAIDWARDAGLKVMIDLHGAPGSQNGFDNSGNLGAINWLHGLNRMHTVEAVTALSKRYASRSDTVTSIELLNEPLGPVINNRSAIESFYKSAASAVRQAAPHTTIAFHDAFYDVLSWNEFFKDVSPAPLLDTHAYQVFSPGELSRSPAQHIETACAFGNNALRISDQRIVVGEWTAAQTDCAKWLNGLGTGARYDGKFPDSHREGTCAGKSEGTVKGLSSQRKKDLRRYVEAQLDAYEQSAGWFFWTWKTESAPEWHLKDLIAEGLFPQPLDNRQHKNQCNY